MSRAPRYRHEHPSIVNMPAFSPRLIWRLIKVIAHITLGFILAFLTGMFFVQHKAWQKPVMVWWLQHFVRVLNLQVRVEGEPVNEGALWISNHVSWMDIPVLGSIRALQFLSKAEVAKWPLIGTLARAVGTLFIQRGAGDSKRVVGDMVTELNSGRRVLFFPEGTTTDGFQVKRFFANLFAAAVETGVPIQPMVICYQQDDGSLHSLAPFIGDDDIAPHLLNMLAFERIHVVVRILPAERPNGRDQRELAIHFEALLLAQLQSLHGAELPPSRLDHPAARAA